MFSNPIPIWDIIKIFIVFSFCIQLPGVLVTYLAYRSVSISFAIWAALSTALGLAIVTSIGAFIGVIGGSLNALVLAVLIVDLLLLAIVLYVYRGSPGSRRVILPIKIDQPFVGLVVLNLFLFGVALRIGAIVAYKSDAWFHIASISEVIERQVALPLNAYWQDLPAYQAAGMWHVVLGLISHIAGVEILTTWHVVNALLVVVAVTGMYGIASALLDHNWLGLAVAFIYVLGRGGNGMSYWLRTQVYPAQLCYVLLWMAFFYFYLYIKNGQRRDFVIGLVLGNLPLLVHPQEYIYLCCGISLFMLLTLFISNDRWVLLKRSASFLAMLLIIGGPLMWIRFDEFIVKSMETNVAVSQGISFMPSEGAAFRQVLAFLSPAPELDRWVAAFLPLGLFILSISVRIFR